VYQLIHQAKLMRSQCDVFMINLSVRATLAVALPACLQVHLQFD